MGGLGGGDGDGGGGGGLGGGGLGDGVSEQSLPAQPGKHMQLHALPTYWYNPVECATEHCGTALQPATPPVEPEEVMLQLVPLYPALQVQSQEVPL